MRALFAVLAIAALVLIRLGDPPTPTVTIAEVAPQPVNDPHPVIARSTTAVATAQPPTPTNSGSTWVSPDGVWTLTYPQDWFVAPAGTDRWNLTSFAPGASEGGPLDDGEFKVTLTIESNGSNLSTDDLLKSYCDGMGDPEVTIQDCSKVSYTGDIWAWAVGHDDVYGGATDMVSGIVAGGKIYQLGAIVPDGPHESTGLAEVRGIMESSRID